MSIADNGFQDHPVCYYSPSRSWPVTGNLAMGTLWTPGKNKRMHMRKIIFIACLSTCGLPVTLYAKACEELKSEIEAKLQGRAVSAYSLEIVTAADTGDGKVIGSCDAGSKRILYARQGKVKATPAIPRDSIAYEVNEYSTPQPNRRGKAAPATQDSTAYEVNEYSTPQPNRRGKAAVINGIADSANGADKAGPAKEHR
jgi:hypothetical protein